MMSTVERILVELKPWQRDIINIIETPEIQTIHWVYDPTGNSGKSFLCRYLCCTYDCVSGTGGGNDIYEQCTQREQNPDIILFDVCRSERINYSVLKQLKKGYIVGKKGVLYFGLPVYVIIFNHKMPDSSKITMDRLVIHQI